MSEVIIIYLQGINKKICLLLFLFCQQSSYFIFNSVMKREDLSSLVRRIQHFINKILKINLYLL
jgi:hypothetical protein